MASCTIPGIFEAAQLMGRDRNGRVVPFFDEKHCEGASAWRFTDGGLQAGLWLESALDPGWRHRPVCPHGAS